MKKKQNAKKCQIFKIDNFIERIRIIIQFIHKNIYLFSFSKFKIYYPFMSVNEKIHDLNFDLQNAFQTEL